MTLSNIPPKDRPALFARELRAVFPTAQGLSAEVGDVFTVVVKYNHVQAWAELQVAGHPAHHYMSFNLRTGLEKARDRIEAECRKALLLIGRNPDAVPSEVTL